MKYDCSFQPDEHFPENELLGERNSFSGRKYAPLLRYLTGHDLSQGTLDALAVQQIAGTLRQKLAQCQTIESPDVIVWRDREGRCGDISLHDLRQLVIIFDFAAAQQLSLLRSSEKKNTDGK